MTMNSKIGSGQERFSQNRDNKISTRNSAIKNIFQRWVLTLERFNMQFDCKKKLFIKKYPIPFLELCWIILQRDFTYRKLSFFYMYAFKYSLIITSLAI